MTKQLLFICLISSSIFSCDVRSKTKKDVASPLVKQIEIKDPTTVKVIDSVFNFGKVTEGEIVTYNYRFVNSGNKPLIVTEANASCGCTIPEKPTEAIQPGDTGYIKVKFNSEKRVGQAHKTVTVQSNAEPIFPQLLLTGEVVAKKEN
jgi:Protein of unknown function (DUF1573)